MAPAGLPVAGSMTALPVFARGKSLLGVPAAFGSESSDQPRSMSITAGPPQFVLNRYLIGVGSFSGKTIWQPANARSATTGSRRIGARNTKGSIIASYSSGPYFSVFMRGVSIFPRSRCGCFRQDVELLLGDET